MMACNQHHVTGPQELVRQVALAGDIEPPDRGRHGLWLIGEGFNG